MKVVKIPLDKLRRPEKNVRRHSEKQIGEFVRSVNMFGQIRPIVVDEEYTMLAGNGLYEALKQTGATDADCYVIPGLTAAQKKKLMLADNRIYSLGADNLDVFDEIIAELGADIDIPGYDEELLRTLNASAADLDRMILDYGTFAAEDRQAMRANAEKRVEVAPMPSAPPEGPLQPSPPQGDMEHAPAAQAARMPLQPPTDAPSDEPFLICPHCGGRVPLEGVG